MRFGIKNIKRVWNNVSYLLKTSFEMFKGLYFLKAFQSIFSTIVPFVNLYFPKWILDELSTECQWEQVMFLIALWAGISGVIVLVEGITDSFSAVYWDECARKEQMIWYNISADMEYSKKEDGIIADEGDRIASNINFVNFPQKIMDMISSIVQLVGYTYIIITVHPLIVVFIFAIIFLNTLLSKKTQLIDFEYQKIIPKYNRMFNYLFKVFISFSYAKEVKINNAADLARSKYRENQKEYMSIYKKNIRKHLSIGSLSELVLFFQTLVLYGYSGYQAASGNITIGDFTMLAGAAEMFIGNLGLLVSKILEIKHQSEYVDAYVSFMDNVLPKDPQDCIENFSKETPEIEFVQVSFKYPRCENYILNNVSFRVKSGERLCIVGYNGAGKTTLIKLLCKLYQPTTGKILFNGTDIWKIRNKEYYPLLSVVFQDFNIYSLSFKDNICLEGEFEMSRFQNAVTLCGLSNKLKEFPLDMETQITKEYDESGVELSGGEGQKLATARAYYKNTPLIILDEPTASLDPIAESNMYQRFDSIMESKTAIYISHRLASVKFCDKVLVMAEGEIAGYGTHEELINNNDLYREMYVKQSAYYSDGK